MVFVSANPEYPYDYKASLCLEENDISSYSIRDSVGSCSAIYIIDGNTGDIKEIIKLRQGEIIRDIYMDILPYSKIYAVGEYNYLENDTNSNVHEPVEYEDDVTYIINTTYSGNITRGHKL